ncbi:MAG: MFS transporter [Pirellulaceae bacterium]
MDSNALNRSMRLSVAEGGLATAMGSLFSGVFLTGFALAMGATPLQIGILFALPSISGIAQLAGSYWIERFGSSRGLCLLATATSRLLYLPVLLVSLFATGVSSDAKVWWIVGIMAVSGMLGSLGGVAWLTWIRALVPSNLRVSFFGRRNFVNSALSFVPCLLAGVLIDYWSDIEGSGLGGFVIVFAVAMVCGLVSLALLARIPPGIMAPAPSHREPFGRMILSPLRESNYRRIVCFYGTWNLAVNVATPFYSVFFLEKLGLPVWFIVVLNGLSNVSALAANNVWTRLAHRFGMKPIVLVASVGDAIYPLCLIFVDAPWAWVLLLVHLSGVFNAPVAMGPDNFILKLAPERNGSSYMAVFRTVVGLATALAAVLGGWLAGSVSGNELTFGAMTLGGLKIVFCLSFVGRLASLFLLYGVREPGAHSIRHTARVLHRSWRLVRAARCRADSAAVVLRPQTTFLTVPTSPTVVPAPHETHLPIESPPAA